MGVYRPPFSITPKTATALASIHRLLGSWDGAAESPAPPPRLRKDNHIQTVKDTLAIEGNTLSLEQVTALLEGKRVVGPHREIVEVQNANKAYTQADDFNPLSKSSLLKAHAVFMKGLLPTAGHFRTKGVGIVKGSKVVHVAPPAARIPALMRDIFEFAAKDLEIPALIRAAVFHYELEFIHPFDDGNGRLGRFWQHLLFQREAPIFRYVPAESLIRSRQSDYYNVLEACDRAGACDLFVELMLDVALKGLQQLSGQVRAPSATPEQRLARAAQALGKSWFRRKEYMGLFPALSTATASRDVKLGLHLKLLQSQGEGRLTQYRFEAG